MELNDVLTLILASWGAILSTYLAYLKFRAEKRYIKTIRSSYERTDTGVTTMSMDLINVGHRPITVLDIRALIYERRGIFKTHKRYKVVSQLLQLSQDFSLPFTLNEGEFKHIKFDTDMNNLLKDRNVSVDFRVYDADGNVHKPRLTDRQKEDSVYSMSDINKVRRRRRTD